VNKFDEYCADGEYYEHIIHHIIQCFVQPGQIVVDGGAHRELHTFTLCDKVGATGRVYAIEPIAERANALKEAGRPHMQVVEMAITDHTGEAVFYHRSTKQRTNALGRSISLSDPDLNPIRVAARMLDEIVPEHETVRFINLDLEGGEFDALRGARRILERDRPLIIFQHGGNSSASRYNYRLFDFARFWDELGYKVVDLFGRPKHGKGFEEQSVRYLVAGADNDSLQLINNLEIPITLAAQQMARKNRSFGLRSVPQGYE
jgi:FkbM family methyltransferase